WCFCWCERTDDLRALDSHRPRSTYEPGTDLVALAPHYRAIGLQAVHFDDQLERVGNSERAVDTQPDAGVRNIPHGAGDGDVAIVGGSNARFQNAAARRRARVVRRLLAERVADCTELNDRTAGPGNARQRVCSRASSPPVLLFSL